MQLKASFLQMEYMSREGVRWHNEPKEDGVLKRIFFIDHHLLNVRLSGFFYLDSPVDYSYICSHTIIKVGGTARLIRPLNFS